MVVGSSEVEIYVHLLVVGLASQRKVCAVNERDIVHRTEDGDDAPVTAANELLHHCRIEALVDVLGASVSPLDIIDVLVAVDLLNTGDGGDRVLGPVLVVVVVDGHAVAGLGRHDGVGLGPKVGEASGKTF